MAHGSARTFRIFVATLAVVVAIVGIGAPVSANVTVTSGNLLKISPPTDVLQSGLCSPDKVFTFDERQGVTLGSDVRVDYNAIGSYSANGPAGGLAIPAGTVVDSHFLDSNVGACGGNPNREGTWKFSQDILGVIVARPRLVNSDYLGATATNYPGSVPSREFDFGSGTSADFVQIVDARTIYVKLQTQFSSADQMRVITKHNSAPVPNAGGPYAGNEGSTVTLAGSAPDPDSDPVTKSWNFTWTASPGTVCTTAGVTTLTPTINCNDDALVTATLSATDGFHPAVTSVANVTISNRAPTISSATVPATPVALGAPVNLSAVFGDVGAHDTHTASVAWGDVAITSGVINESGHSVTASHVYAAPGVYSLTLTVNDDDGGTVSVATADVTVVGPPTASAGGPYNGDEGSGTTLAGSASGTLPTTTNWTFSPGVADAGTACNYTGTASLTPVVTCNDDVVVGATLTVSDGVNVPVVSSTNVAVGNVAPVLGALNATVGPIIAGQPVTVGGSFTDAGTNDAHVSTVDWGDMTTSPASVTESAGSGSVSATHAYPLPGVYTVSVDVNDGDGGIATRTIVIRVNTPPTANANGPYAGPEGSTLTLGATASDDDADPLSTTWSFSVAGAPSSVCTFGATTTLAPTVTCTDNATVTATLTVSDGVNPPVVRVTTVAVGNVAPTVGTVTVTASPVAVGSGVSASLPFSDVGTSDTHTATIDWGDGNVTAATIVESSGAGTASGGHSYVAAGSYTVTITVIDDDLETSTAVAPAPVVVNGPPTASAGGPYSVSEGSSLTLAGTASDPELDPLTTAWTYSVAGTAGTACTSTGDASLTPTIVCNDNAIVTATLTVSDGINPPVVSTATVGVTNVAPTAHPPVPSPMSVGVGVTLSVASGFSDPGTHDTHFAFIFWGDGNVSLATIAESGGTGSASGTHAYSAPGSYTISITIVDDDTGGTTVSTPSPVVVT